MADFIVCLIALMFVCSQRHMCTILWQNFESISSCQINKRRKMQRWTVSSDLLWKMSFYAFGRANYWLITNHLCCVLKAKCTQKWKFCYNLFILVLFQTCTTDWLLFEHRRHFFVHIIKVVGVQCCFATKQLKHSSEYFFFRVWQKGECGVFWPACLQGWRASHGHML